MFISIHADSLGERQGLQVYYPGSGPGKKSAGPVTGRDASHVSLQLAGDVQNALSRQSESKPESTPERAPAQPVFAVLNGIRSPAVLVEIPFAETESPLLDPAKRQQVAEDIYRGIAAYVKVLPDRTIR
jgi:N-acetylmuramoyl-L-alanine amidase